ncbi:MAG TPA: MFS transporter [Propionibacteriaceae bacterium]|nr:MFS transporter [Propionibacteriaceae bacterium]
MTFDNAAPHVIDPVTLRKARTAVFIVFAASGFGFASWASRLPDIQQLLGLTPGELGRLLLMIAAGSVLGLPSSGAIIAKLGTRRTVRSAALLFVVGALIAAVAVSLLRNPYLTGFGMFLMGLGVGVWDVAMNHEGAGVERLGGRAIMPWFHAAFSGATVVGALIGAGVVYLGIPVWAHIAGVTAAITYVALVTVRAFLPESEIAEDGPGAAHPGQSAWLEPKTILIGVVVAAAAFTEGTANDWVAIALRDGYGLPVWAGVLGFATFLGAMTAGRLLGTGAIDKYGRIPVLYAMFALAILGSLLFVFGGPILAFVGTILWGVGGSLGFPVGMSAASDDPVRAAARLSVVATVGYLAFLGGPPLVGYLGDHVGVLKAMLVVGALLVPALLAVPATRENR